MSRKWLKKIKTRRKKQWVEKIGEKYLITALWEIICKCILFIKSLKS